MAEVMPRRVALVAHCLLNPATRAWESPERQARPLHSAGAEVLAVLAEYEIGVYQLPCPEFLKYGNPRKLRSLGEYEALPGFKNYCDELGKRVTYELVQLVTLAMRPRLELVMVLGVGGSPTCAYAIKAAMDRGDAASQYCHGLFLRALQRELNTHGIDVPFLEISFHPVRFQESLSILRKFLMELG